jgi:hypothetical protein
LHRLTAAPVARSLLRLIGAAAWLGCSSQTSTTLSQTADGTTRALPRAGDVLQIAPDNIEGETLVDVPGAPGQPSLRIASGSVKLDLSAKSVGFVLGPPEWAEVVVRCSLFPKSPLRGTMNAANGVALPTAFDAPAFPDASSRIGFAVKALSIDQLPNGEITASVRVAIRGLSNTTLMRLGYQVNILWTPGGPFPSPEPPAKTEPPVKK